MKWPLLRVGDVLGVHEMRGELVLGPAHSTPSVSPFASKPGKMNQHLSDESTDRRMPSPAGRRGGRDAEP